MSFLTMNTDEIIEYMREKANSSEAFGKDFNTNKNSDWYALNMPIATTARYILDIVATRFDNLEMSKSDDPYFYGLASNFLFFRKNPAYSKSSRVRATNPIIGATAKVGEIQIKKVNSDIIYSNVNDITVDKIPFDFLCRCEEVGTLGDTPIGSVTEIVSTPSNWGATFSNVLPFEGGQDLETLEEARKRFFNQQSTQTNWNTDGIYAEIIKLAGVNSVRIVQNRTDVTVGGVPRRAIHIIVDGGNQSEIFSAIYRKVLPATFTFGSNRGTINDLSGQPIEVGFDRPTGININYKVELMPTSTSVPNEIYTYIEEYIKKIGVGEVVSSDEIACYVKEKSTISRHYKSLYVGLRKGGTGVFAPAIQLDSVEKAVPVKVV